MKSTKFPAVYSGRRGRVAGMFSNSSSFFGRVILRAPHGYRDAQADTLAGGIQDETSADIDIHQSVQLCLMRDHPFYETCCRYRSTID